MHFKLEYNKKILGILMNKKTNKKIILSKSFIGLILSAFLLILPLLNNKYIRGHDSYFHATNMLLTQRNIDIKNLQFSLPKVFGGKIANGFGYGTGIFYPPLSYYLTSYITKIFHMNQNDSLFSLTIVAIVIILLSGITMYIFLKKVFKNNKIAGIGSISYISSTYFLCNIYVRMALAESLTFIFIPIVFLGLYELFFGEEKRFDNPFIIGYIGMIYSHLVMSIYLTLIIIIVFIIFSKYVFKINKIKKLFLSSIIILLITSPYIIPLLEHKLLGNYAVFEPELMYATKSIYYTSLKLEDYFLIKPITKSGIRIFINPIVLIISSISILFSKKIFREEKHIYTIVITMLIITAFISSKCFPWNKMPLILKIIQYPWRLRTIIAFLLAIISGNFIKIIKCNNNNILFICIAVLITITGYILIPKYRIDDIERLNISDTKFTHMGTKQEYLPVNTKNNIDYFNNRTTEIKIKQGTAEIKKIKDDVPNLVFEIEIDSETVTLELPRLYYLGYDIKFTDNMRNTKKIKYSENEYGFIEILLKESGTIEILHRGTIANIICNYISIITIIIYLGVKYLKRMEIIKKEKNSLYI